MTDPTLEARLERVSDPDEQFRLLWEEIFRLRKAEEAQRAQAEMMSAMNGRLKSDMESARAALVNATNDGRSVEREECAMLLERFAVGFEEDGLVDAQYAADQIRSRRRG